MDVTTSAATQISVLKIILTKYMQEKMLKLYSILLRNRMYLGLLTNILISVEMIG